ncbi:MAG: hypothetical protein IPK14_03445 [Blastocatellia bacterium]|nr:hypothetical protein [Blastocatellia bacterium]MBL8195684.1 hypothetical protein [Blastocatellia bacterium]MBN8722734.1 hypothetical protein [Acidobacteriota bacterium]
MKKASLLFLVLIVCVSLASAVTPQKKKKRSNTKETTEVAKPAVNNSQIQVRVRYTNGREVAGRLINITMSQVVVDAGNGLVVTSSLQEVASLNVGVGEIPAKIDPQFISDANTALQSLTSLSAATSGITFSQYQPKVDETKRAIDTFLTKYEKNNQSELVKSIKAIIRGYETVTPIWSLRVGLEQHKYVYDYSEQMKPVFELYPQIKQVTWKEKGQYYPIEKVIAWIWQENTRLVDQTRQQVSKLK